MVKKWHHGKGIVYDRKRSRVRTPAGAVNDARLGTTSYASVAQLVVALPLYATFCMSDSMSAKALIVTQRLPSASACSAHVCTCMHFCMPSSLVFICKYYRKAWCIGDACMLVCIVCMTRIQFAEACIINSVSDRYSRSTTGTDVGGRAPTSVMTTLI